MKQRILDNLSHDIYCYTLKTRKMFLRMEQIKYQDYAEIKIEEEMHGPLPIS